MDYFEKQYMEKMYGRIGCLSLILVVIIALMGCRSSSLTEMTEIHDTLTINKVDTVTIYKQSTKIDTTKQIIERIITLNKDGDTIRVKETNNYIEKIIERDSAAYYRHIIDSLLHSKNANHDKDVVQVKDPPWWERIGDKLIIVILVAVIVALLVGMFRKRNVSS